MSTHLPFDSKSDAMTYSEESELDRSKLLKKFSIILGSIAVFLSLIPFLIALTATPSGHLLLGYPYNADDHMVYAAWIKQSMDGRFFFDNRFTIINQPGQTIHLYYWILGKIANFTGILVATTIARAGFSFLFVFQLGGYIRRHKMSVFSSKVAMTVAVFGMGVGFLVWENFGRIIKNGLLGPIFQSRLPIDVWQPEAFVFSSMLTNGLFMASLCLMLFLMNCVLDLQTSSSKVIPGSLAMLTLMNIHSYDVMSLALVWGIFLCSMVVNKKMTSAWVVRVICMSIGVIPAALWFIHVLQIDPVFQARAATPTYTAGFRAVIGGLIFLIVLAMIGLWKSSLEKKTSKPAIACASALLLSGFIFGSVAENYWMNWLSWIVCLIAGFAIVCQLMDPIDDAKNMSIAWAFGSMIAIYAPVLFQRKMAAGMSIPWAILAAIGITMLLTRKGRGERNMVMAITVFGLCLGSIMWLKRDLNFVANNTSSTGTLPISLGRDNADILQILGDLPDNTAFAIAPFGALNQKPNGEFGAPFLSDLNPVISGLAGMHTLAGHWSETPNYAKMRTIQNQLLLNEVDFDDTIAKLNPRFGVVYVITPSDPNLGGVKWRDFRSGYFSDRSERLYSGQSLSLFRVTLK